MVFGLFAQSSVGESFRVGGTTLATEIYRLTSAEVVDWNKVAAIGIVIVSMILIITVISKQLENKNWKQVAVMTAGSVLSITGIMIGNFYLFIISLSLTVLIPLMESSYNYYKLHPHKFDWLKINRGNK
jgi:ABC-type Fe3+ transport system permease subunit